ncbi:hypothetical protein FQN60_009711 [Etheostoma spectabile]|uniref:R-spondin Fu-CRD domain-containing protein n=1 Tax=Etheostoma spectabile TaxID=54343 RepID=A0A5J5DJN9_9PERO|nr:hypothetical protein FQN60_009711 [Etheostoma spectabile]
MEAALAEAAALQAEFEDDKSPLSLHAGLAQESPHRETSEDCRSCLECSRDNGCVRCPERLFLFLQREGMSHHGTSHLGVECDIECRSLDCEHCFSRDFCTKCKPGFQLYKGKCLTRCPGGTFAHQTDCVEDCLLAPLGEWSDWSVCLRDGVPCGFRWGKQTRTRGGGPSGRAPEEKAASFCPSHSETQRCRMKKRCPTEKLTIGTILQKRSVSTEELVMWSHGLWVETGNSGQVMCLRAEQLEHHSSTAELPKDNQ